MEPKRGHLRKLSDKRPPIVRLVSTASYTRPALPGNLAPGVAAGAHPADALLSSTYRRTLCDPSADKAAAAARCVAARAEASRRDLVLSAARALPLDVLDRVGAETAAARDAAGATAAASAAAVAATAAARAIPVVTPAVEALSSTLASELRRPQNHVLVKTFFSSGTGGGPFPGQTSELGEVMAGAYWTEAARLGNTRMVMGKPASKFAPGGYRLLNHNHM
jgi:hypothetical protein